MSLSCFVVLVNMVLLQHCNTLPGEDITGPVYLTPATICWEPVVEP